METSAQQLRALEDIAVTIGACIDEVSMAQLHETAALLSIARLDLMARIHHVTEQELAQLERAVGREAQTVRQVVSGRRPHARRNVRRMTPGC